MFDKLEKYTSKAANGADIEKGVQKFLASALVDDEDVQTFVSTYDIDIDTLATFINGKHDFATHPQHAQEDMSPKYLQNFHKNLGKLVKKEALQQAFVASSKFTIANIHNGAEFHGMQYADDPVDLPIGEEDMESLKSFIRGMIKISEFNKGDMMAPGAGVQSGIRKTGTHKNYAMWSPVTLVSAHPAMDDFLATLVEDHVREMISTTDGNGQFDDYSLVKQGNAVTHTIVQAPAAFFSTHLIAAVQREYAADKAKIAAPEESSEEKLARTVASAVASTMAQLNISAAAPAPAPRVTETAPLISTADEDTPEKVMEALDRALNA